MRTIFDRNDDKKLIVAAINEVGQTVDITKYAGRLRLVQLTIAEGMRQAGSIARVTPPVTEQLIAEVLP